MEPLLLHEFFEQTAQRWPDHVAVDVPPGIGRPDRIEITYAELSRQAGALSLTLEPAVCKECVVAIFMHRNSPLLYAAQLAVLQSGAAYVCIDPAFPDERMREILEDSEAVAVLTDAAGYTRLQGGARHLKSVFDASAVQPPAGECPASRRPAWLDPASLAYVIYTSGTTGRPKGVLIEHRSIVNLVAGDLEEFQLAPGDRVGQGSSAAYDSSLEETWLAFAAGATVVVMDDDTARLGPDLIPWLHRERITVFCPPPTLLRATGCEHPDKELPELKLLYVGGEALPRDVADRWARGRRMVNGYGPTECTVTSLRGDVVPGGEITIGRPVPGLTAFVLNESMEEAPEGSHGELCLGGIGLARGYWNRPELTAEKFIHHPVCGRLYRTGDLVHRDHTGCYHYHGRMDSQVKVRGYRIELEEIESRLTRCPGVRAAACHVQEEAGHTVLVAFIVPENDSTPPAAGELKAALMKDLPAYMVPSRFGVLQTLPATVGGKLNRAALPRLEGFEAVTDRKVEPPRNAMEAALEAAFRDILQIPRPVSVHDDFFRDLGGDSLRAAMLVTLLRNHETTAWVTVRHLYEARTVAAMAALTPAAEDGAAAIPAAEEPRRTGKPLTVTMVQAAWILATGWAGAWLVYLAAFQLMPWMTESTGLVPAILLIPVAGIAAMLIYAPLSLTFAVAVKRVLIGRYRPLRTPVWSGFYLRHWIVQQAVRLIPWRSMEGTVYQHFALRALGAKIGRGVHIHRGVDLLKGGWDLLDIGDNVTLSQDAELLLTDLLDGDLVVGRVSIGSGSTLDIRAAVGGDTVVETGAYLTALSSLPPGGRIPAGERWDGIPAAPAGAAPQAPAVAGSPAMSPLGHSLLMLSARAAVAFLLALPLELLAIAACLLFGLSAEHLWEWMGGSLAGWQPWIVVVSVLVLSVPLTLLMEAALMRVAGRIPQGVISRWSPAWIRVSIKTGILESASRWLSGTLLWPAWLRLAGMKIGPGCEISTIIDVIPEHVEIGGSTFFSDGIYLGGPRIHQGTVTMAATRLGRNTFLGNHVVIPAGQHLPDDILLGVCTVADDTTVRPGTSWFGLPPFELPRREVVDMDRSLTHEPSAIRYANRVFWELLRFTLPVVPGVTGVIWFRLVSGAEESGRLALMVPLAALGVAVFLCLLVLAMKWLLLGKVRPGQHALWSCWCSRWDFLYVAWGQYAAPVLSRLEGTLLLTWYLRGMGMKIGRRVVLGSGFAHVVDPDMIHIEDEATVSASYQAHTFEDRVLKIDHVFVRRRATLGSNTVPLYGADIGEGTHVATHSVIMKRERLLPRRRYEGAPTR